MKNNNGITLFELLFAIAALISGAVLGGVFFAACHFLAKFW